jgi:L-fuculokinase
LQSPGQIDSWMPTVLPLRHTQSRRLSYEMTRSLAAAVFDVGKSNVRLCAVDDHGVAMATLGCPNAVHSGPPYPHFDAAALYQWLLKGLSTLARKFEVHSIVPVTHGACAALVDGEGLVLPIMDYEFEGVCEVDSEYDAITRDFARTGSPKLPAGLNLGRQIFWQNRTFPGEFARAKILPYPQYWAWRLSGRAAWEPTSLGCHTDLWEPRSGGFSRFAKALGWDARFPQRANAWTSLGPPSAEVIAATGLPRSCAVLAGIHDSNASYFAHRATRENEPFCVVSTGTWIVMMAHGSPLDSIREERDMLANFDALGNAVPTARFMGGREYAAICGEEGLSAKPSAGDLETLLATGTVAVPSFTEQGGPFRAHHGRIAGQVPGSALQRAALAALYCALMTDLCLEMLEVHGDIVLEGQFASNDAFVSALAAVRSPQPVLRSLDETGTLGGAAMLSRRARGASPEAPRLYLCRAEPNARLNAARRQWRGLLPELP